MAQRQFPCPKCGAVIMVPDDYFRAQIACAYCGIAVDRRTGALPGGASAVPAVQPQAAGEGNPYPAGQPFPQQRAASAPAPVAYPGSGPQYPPQYPMQYPMQYPARKSGSRGLVIGLVIIGGGGVLLVVVVLALAAIPLITSGGIDDSGPWHHYRSDTGRFEIEFPQKPTENSQPLQMQHARTTIYRAACTGFAINFEASYFDLGEGSPDEYEYDYEEGARAVANASKGTIRSQNSRSVGGYQGSIAILDLPKDRRTTLFMLRVYNRVHLLAVENHLVSKQDVADRFIDGFRLIQVQEGQSVVNQLTPWRRAGNTWTTKSSFGRAGDPGASVSFVRNEVLTVSNKVAHCRMTTLDKLGIKISEQDHEVSLVWQEHMAPESNPNNAGLIRSRETITVKAGTFDCEKIVYPLGTTTWTCLKSGLLVLTESETARHELVETNLPH